MLEVAVQGEFGAFALDMAFTAGSDGITALFGRSGAGKTLLVNMLAGLVRPRAGRIALDGTALFDSAAHIDLKPEARRLGYVFQDSRLFPHMSVRGNLVYGRPKRAADRRVDFDHVVTLLGIEPLLERRPKALSGGEKQRVAIGRALLAEPRLLLMDEPLAALDAARKAEILPYIERLRDDLKIPIVYVSHAMEEIVRLADTVVLVSGGRIAAHGPIEEIMGRLDLRPLTGRYEAGAVISATVEGHDERYALTSLRFAGGVLTVPRVELEPGATLRVRVRARDVALALAPPKDTSVLNVFRGTVTEVGAERGPQVDLKLDIGAPLWARVTARSFDALGIEVGKPVYALIKAVALDRHSLGWVGAARFRGDEDGTGI
ncbi:MAG TPA: molybdenum ABC transporter ATP-binding protein [Stellaceae bacterium]|nr:molybdenum ABC transporter ATP-binding protein [Stellaceae bacterium]